MPTSRELEQQIEKVERFRVRIISENGRRVRSDASGFDDYPYLKAASGDLTVASWIESRFSKHYDDYKVKIVNENGCTVHGRTELTTVRTVPKAKLAKKASPALSQEPLLFDTPTPRLDIAEEIPHQITFDDLTSTNIKNCILEAVSDMLAHDNLPWVAGPYLHAVFHSGDLEKAVHGESEVDESIVSSIDSLIHKSSVYNIPVISRK